MTGTAPGYDQSQWSAQDRAFLESDRRSNFGNQASDWQSSKPWYQNEVFAGGVAAGIGGITNYLLEQERQRGLRSLQNDRIAAEERTINDAVKRTSTMPLLQRIVPNKKGLKPWPGIGGAYIK